MAMTLAGASQSFRSNLRRLALTAAVPVAQRLFPGQGGRVARRLARWALVRAQAIATLRGTLDGSAVVWPELGRATVDTFDLATPGRGQVLILVHSTAVSPGTEGANFANLPNTSVSFPYSPGYSGAGTVVQIGRAVTRCRVGDTVAASMPHASLAVVPESRALAVPQGVALEEAAFVHLGVIALQAVRKGSLRQGEAVAVLGQGILGHLLVQLAAASGAYPVTAIARTQARLGPAQASGATRAISLATEGPNALKDLYADAVFEVTGNPQAVIDAIACVRPGGRIVLAGSSRGATHSLPVALARQKGITIIGAHVDSVSPWSYPREAETFLRLLETRRLRISPLISHRVHPWEAERFYRQLALGEGGIIGTIFTWDALPDSERFRHTSYFTPPRELVKSGLRLKISPLPRTGPVAATELPSPGRANPSDSISPKPGAGTSKGTTSKGTGPLRIALVGCGEIGATNAAAVAHSGNAVLSVTVDLDEALARDLGRRYGVPFSTDPDAALTAHEADAVFICTPPASHAPLALKALEHGKHVMVEKPMSLTVAEAETMVHAAVGKGLLLSVCFCQRYLPHVQRAKELVAQGVLGKLLGSHLVLHLDKPAAYWAGGHSGRAKDPWRTTRAASGGGVLAANLVHYVDWLRYLTEADITQVSAEYGTLESPAEVEDSIAISLRYSNGAIGSVMASSCVRGIVGELVDLRLWGSDGQVSLSAPPQFYTLRNTGAGRPGQWHTFGRLPRVNERARYVARFADAVCIGIQPDITGEDGLAVQRIVEAAYRSGEIHAPVTV